LQYHLYVARREALIVRAGGELFRFYYDAELPEILHITLRHGTVPQDAIHTFFQGRTAAWDDVHARHETMTESQVIYWTRHPADQSVIIISCFRRGDE
jgi:hypothetical protein